MTPSGHPQKTPWILAALLVCSLGHAAWADTIPQTAGAGLPDDQRTHPNGPMGPNPDQAGVGTLVLDYSSVAHDADFPVIITALSKIEPTTSYVYLVPSNLPHHNERLAEDQRLTYHNVGEMERVGANRGRLIFDAPSETGSYDLRLFDRGRELSTVTFRVGASAVRNQNTGSPPLDD